MKTVCFWSDQTPRPDNLLVTDLPERVDVAIVGGGYTGLHAARTLRKSGASVAVLDQHTIGWGASSRNGGMVTTGLKASARVIYKKHGPALARHFWRWALDAIDHVDHTIRSEVIDCDFGRPGHAAMAYKPSHFERYKATKQWFETQLDYHGHRLVAPGELGSEIGSQAFYGALTDDFSGGLNPAKYVFGLAGAVARSGAHLVEQARVTGIRRENGQFRLAVAHKSAAAELRANEVLLATNGYTTALVPRARWGIFPVGSYIIVTEPLPAALQAELSPKGRMFYDSKWFLNYFRLTADGRMLFGGRNNLSTGLDLHDSARLLQTRMVEVFPKLANVPVTHSWTGQLGITFDLMPHVGRINGIHYAYGYGGHGVSISSYLGHEAGQLLAGQRTSTPFADIRHPRFIGAGLDRWFLPLVAGWYRFLDRIS